MSHVILLICFFIGYIIYYLINYINHFSIGGKLMTILEIPGEPVRGRPGLSKFVLLEYNSDLIPYHISNGAINLGTYNMPDNQHFDEVTVPSYVNPLSGHQSTVYGTRFTIVDPVNGWPITTANGLPITMTHTEALNTLVHNYPANIPYEIWPLGLNGIPIDPVLNDQTGFVIVDTEDPTERIIWPLELTDKYVGVSFEEAMKNLFKLNDDLAQGKQHGADRPAPGEQTHPTQKRKDRYELRRINKTNRITNREGVPTEKIVPDNLKNTAFKIDQHVTRTPPSLPPGNTAPEPDGRRYTIVNENGDSVHAGDPMTFEDATNALANADPQDNWTILQVGEDGQPINPAIDVPQDIDETCNAAPDIIPLQPNEAGNLEITPGEIQQIQDQLGGFDVQKGNSIWDALHDLPSDMDDSVMKHFNALPKTHLGHRSTRQWLPNEWSRNLRRIRTRPQNKEEEQFPNRHELGCIVDDVLSSSPEDFISVTIQELRKPANRDLLNRPNNGDWDKIIDLIFRYLEVNYGGAIQPGGMDWLYKNAIWPLLGAGLSDDLMCLAGHTWDTVEHSSIGFDLEIFRTFLEIYFDNFIYYRLDPDGTNWFHSVGLFILKLELERYLIDTLVIFNYIVTLKGGFTIENGRVIPINIIKYLGYILKYILGIRYNGGFVDGRDGFRDNVYRFIFLYIFGENWLDVGVHFDFRETINEFIDNVWVGIPVYPGHADSSMSINKQWDLPIANHIYRLVYFSIYKYWWNKIIVPKIFQGPPKDPNDLG